MLSAGDAGVFLARRGEDPAHVYPRDLPVYPETPRDGGGLLARNLAAAVNAIDWLAPAACLVVAPFLSALSSSLSHPDHD